MQNNKKEYKIQVFSEEESVRAQKAFFKLGYSWMLPRGHKYSDEPRNTSEQFLYGTKTGRIFYGTDEENFNTGIGVRLSLGELEELAGIDNTPGIFQII